MRCRGNGGSTEREASRKDDGSAESGRRQDWTDFVLIIIVSCCHGRPLQFRLWPRWCAGASLILLRHFNMARRLRSHCLRVLNQRFSISVVELRSAIGGYPVMLRRRRFQHCGRRTVLLSGSHSGLFDLIVDG